MAKKTGRPKGSKNKKNQKALPAAGETTEVQTEALAVITPSVHNGIPPEQDAPPINGKWDPVYEAEKAGATEEYVKLIRNLMDAKAMCDTEAFRKLYRSQKERLKDIGDELMVVEKSVDLHHMQGEARYIKHLMALYEEPVAALDSYIIAQPLFANQMKLRAEFNRALGKIVVKHLD
jgi:hypothetical protein